MPVNDDAMDAWARSYSIQNVKFIRNGMFYTYGVDHAETEKPKEKLEVGDPVLVVIPVVDWGCAHIEGDIGVVIGTASDPLVVVRVFRDNSRSIYLPHRLEKVEMDVFYTCMCVNATMDESYCFITSSRDVFRKYYKDRSGDEVFHYHTSEQDAKAKLFNTCLEYNLRALSRDPINDVEKLREMISERTSKQKIVDLATDNAEVLNRMFARRDNGARFVGGAVVNEQF